MAQFEPTKLPGVLTVTPRRFGDERGWFSESWNRKVFEEAGIDVDWVQDNHSFSAARGTLRGLHYQAPPHAQAKLVRCTAGAIWDVTVDVRRSSAHYGKWVGVELSAETGRQVFVPRGFLHGFVTLTDNAEVQYKCSAAYAPEADGSVAWNSPSLAIDWPLDGAPELSAKDEVAPDFADWTSPFDGEHP